MISKTSKTTINRLMLLLFLSISLLFINTLLPWLSVNQNIGLTDKQYFNLEMMENSETDIIKNYAGKINLINYLLWALIIISLISLLVIIYYSFSETPNIYQYLMLLSGIGALIISSIVIYLYYTVITQFNENSAISPATVISHLKYSHFSVIFLIFILLITLFNSKMQIEELLIKIKKFKPKVEKKKEIKKIKTEKETIEYNEAKQTNKREEMEDWLADEIKNIDEKTQESKIEKFWEQKEQKNISNQEKLVKEKDPIKIEDENRNQEVDFEKKSFQEPFPKEKPKEKYNSDDLKISDSFEKALSSAIEKKQSQIKQIQPIDNKIETKELDKKVIKKEEKKQEIEQKPLTVRCPQCTHIFSIEKKEGNTKIKCPECGKEGIIK